MQFTHSTYYFSNQLSVSNFASGGMAEWFNAAVLKTVDGDEPSGGSNPSPSASHILPLNSSVNHHNRI